LRSLGFYRLCLGGGVRGSDREKWLEMQSLGSAFYFARLRKHAPRLAEFSFTSSGGLEGAVERHFMSAGIRLAPAVSTTRRLSVLGKPYWHELFSKKWQKNSIERDLACEL
jgi:hypothetical protein